MLVALRESRRFVPQFAASAMALSVMVATGCASDTKERHEHVAAMRAEYGDCAYDAILREQRMNEGPILPGPRLDRGLVECYLKEGRDDALETLIQKWTGEADTAERVLIEARVLAKRGDGAATKDKLQVWQALPRTAIAGLEAKEFDTYRASDWFSDVVLTALAKEKTGHSAAELTKELQRLGQQVIDLRVAVAGPERVVGKLAVWEGVVVDARIDERRQRTLLFAEGFDVDTQVVESRPDLRTYEVIHTYEEQFVRNGRGFFVLVEGTDPKVLEMKAVTVVGRIAPAVEKKSGEKPIESVRWDGQAITASTESQRWPALDARMVFSRTPVRTEKRIRAY